MSTFVCIVQVAIGCIPPHSVIADAVCFGMAGVWLGLAVNDWCDWFEARS